MAVDVALLQSLYPLNSLQPAHLNLLAEHGEVRDLNRSDVVFDEGDNDGLSFFLLSGRLAGTYSDGREREIDANSPNTRYAVGDLQPRRFTATVTTAAARLVVFDRGLVEKVLTWDQISRSPQFALDSTQESARWVFQMLRSKALLRLPAGNLQRMFERFEQVNVLPSQNIIKEGDDGDFFYVIKTGEFEVMKAEKGQVIQVALLGQGDSFGEDALVSNEKRNATVRSKTAGSLMRLSKSDFAELLRHPVVDWITPGQAAALVRVQGAKLLDVRLEEEFNHRKLGGSINTPLFRLREEMNSRPHNIPYVVCCETGERSASAVFILNKLGYKAFAIRGGLSSISTLLNLTGNAA